jgi:hypothetical protein
MAIIQYEECIAVEDIQGKTMAGLEVKNTVMLFEVAISGISLDQRDNAVILLNVVNIVSLILAHPDGIHDGLARYQVIDHGGVPIFLILLNLVRVLLLFAQFIIDLEHL